MIRHIRYIIMYILYTKYSFVILALMPHPLAEARRGKSLTSLHLKLAEGVGFEPTVTSLPRSISSRVPSTGLSHPSYLRSILTRQE